MKWESEGLYIPMSCQQCQDAPCKIICPVKAISRDDKNGRVMVNHNICIGCRSCVAVCPFGAMNFNVMDRKVFSAISVMETRSVFVSVKSKPWIMWMRTG
jgi:Fe-S-cluster-containing hydrogenase component 2